jgi:hypothetical protein
MRCRLSEESLAGTGAPRTSEIHVGVSEGDLCVIAEQEAMKAPQALTTISRPEPSASSSPTCSSPRSARVTALRRLQRRFSNGVTIVATPF